MLEYMGNEGVGDEEIDRFMGWTTVDSRSESLQQARRAGPSVERRTGVEERGSAGRGFRARKDEMKRMRKYPDGLRGGGRMEDGAE